LLPGQKIKVDTGDGRSHTGIVRSVSDDSLQIGKDQQLRKEDVQQIQLWSPGHHGRNTLIGLVGGGAVGVGIGASCGSDGIVSKGECMAVGAPVFGGIGAIIGAVLPSHGKWHEVYRSK
jgi:hypothetical protein